MIFISELINSNSLFLSDEQKCFIRENCFLKIVKNDEIKNSIFFETLDYKTIFKYYEKKGFNSIQCEFISIWILIAFKYYESDFRDNTEHIFSVLLISKANIFEFYRKKNLSKFYRDFLTQLEPKKSEKEIQEFIQKKYRPYSYFDAIQKMIPGLFTLKDLGYFMKSFLDKNIPFHRICTHCSGLTKNPLQMWQKDDDACITCCVEQILKTPGRLVNFDSSNDI